MYVIFYCRYFFSAHIEWFHPLLHAFSGLLDLFACIFFILQSANKLGYNITSFHTSAVDEAARRGTRARRDAIKRAEKKKRIEKEVKKEFIPYSQRDV